MEPAASSLAGAGTGDSAFLGSVLGIVSLALSKPVCGENVVVWVHEDTCRGECHHRNSVAESCMKRQSPVNSTCSPPASGLPQPFPTASQTRKGRPLLMSRFPPPREVLAVAFECNLNILGRAVLLKMCSGSPSGNAVP